VHLSTNDRQNAVLKTSQIPQLVDALQTVGERIDRMWAQDGATWFTGDEPDENDPIVIRHRHIHHLTLLDNLRAHFSEVAEILLRSDDLACANSRDVRNCYSASCCSSPIFDDEGSADSSLQSIDTDPVETERVWRASPAHAGVAGRLLCDFNTEFETPGPTAEEFGTRLARLLERDDLIVLLAGDEDAPDGLALLTLRLTHFFDGPLAQLEELYVRPACRDQGIGTALLSEAIRLVRHHGGKEMHINVDEVDIDARRFYERHGFINIEPGADYRMLCYLQEL
jgi:ribosomal protein S18 acetylase RimI-like enzyme